MKRFAAVAALGLGLFIAGSAEAGKLPQGERMVGRMKVWRPAHSVVAPSKAPQAPRSVDKLHQWRAPHPEK